MPFLSTTRGCHYPATGVRPHTICDAEELVTEQEWFPRLTLRMLGSKLLPLIVRMPLPRVKLVTEAAGTV